MSTARLRPRKPQFWQPLTWMAVAALVASCATAAGSGRGMSEEAEVAQGAQAATEVEAFIGFAGDEELNAYVTDLGNRLVQHSSRSHLDFEFHVVDMEEPNAFALPGGFIYVSRGLLAIMNREDELAAVLGHEIGHVAARHSVARQRAQKPWLPLQILAGIGGAAASVVSEELGSTVAGLGQVPASLALASYSRKQEEEADRLGQQYIAAEGWDPAALARSMDALTREQELHGGRDPNQRSFFDSHPTTPDRAREARAYAEALTRAPPSPIATDRSGFVTRLDGLVVGASARGGVFIDERFLHPELGFAMTFPQEWNHANAPAAVVAQAPDNSAVLALQVVAEGDDPTPAADAVAAEVPLRERSPLTRTNGMSRITGTARVESQAGELSLYFAWTAKDGLVYEVVGATPSPHWERHRQAFATTAESFRALSSEELAEIEEDRLRLVTARAGETVDEVAERSNSQWSIAKVSAANDMPMGEAVQPGVLVKVSKKEPYER